VREVGIVAQIEAADRLHQAAENAVAVAGDEDVVAVVAAIGVGGRDAGQRAAGGFPHRAERIVFRQQAFHDVEHRLVEGDVHDLSFAVVLVAMAQRHHKADHAVQGGERVADGNPDAHRDASGLGGQVS
jgi:hypothetical protein